MSLIEMDRCPNCSRKGFPILFTRYGIAYSESGQGREALKKLTPKAPMQAVPGMQTVSSNVRMLRPGYLYLYIESKFGDEWKGYATDPHGYLTEFAVEVQATIQALPACQRENHAGNASLVWIKDAEHVKNVWYLFTPDQITYSHLQKVIKPNRAQYMQKFSPQEWLKGTLNQEHSTTAGMLEEQVFEYAALNNDQLQRCSSALMFGLMGGNAQERGWGDYEQELPYSPPSHKPNIAQMSGLPADAKTIIRRQHGYDKVHGQRLNDIKGFLLKNQGAVVACNDALGVAQELGHMQIEGQTLYTEWQLSQAKGHATGVSCEWVLQSALNATSMRELIKKGAVQKVKDRQQLRALSALPLRVDESVERDWTVQDRQRRVNGDAEQDILRDRKAAREKWQDQRKQERQGHQERITANDVDKAQKTGDVEFAQLFDEQAATEILKEQEIVKGNMQIVLDKLGADQVTWLKSSRFSQAMRCYSDKDSAINMPGGGAALSLQLAQCLAGSETNAQGQKLLAELDPFADNVLSKLLSFNNEKIKKTLKKADESVAALPKPEVSGAWYDQLSNILQPAAMHMGLGDKALSYLEAAPQVSSSAKLRSMAWPAHVASLLSVKMVQGLNGLPASQIEAKILRFAALTSLSSLGTTAAEHAKTLVSADQSRLGNAERKLSIKAHQKMSGNSMRGAPAARMAALEGIFDIANAAANGFKFNAKRDMRNATEMIGSLLQGTGSILDYKAKAYEETIFKAIKGTDVFNVKEMQQSMEKLNELQLQRMRLAAFKFLLPAAVISAFLDILDGRLSFNRQYFLLGVVQMAAAVGTIFTIFGVGGAVFGVISPAVAAALGLIGGALAVIAIVAVLLLSEPEWVDWLTDSPLNKKRKGQVPIHKNLQDSLQKLANAQAAI